MSKELIVSLNGREKKIAIIEDDVVTEFYVERGDENQGIVGNIYKGKVMKVLPGMQSAFVDIGLERDAFLYVSDFIDDEVVEGAPKVVEAVTEVVEAVAEVEEAVAEVVEAQDESSSRRRRRPRTKRTREEAPVVEAVEAEEPEVEADTTEGAVAAKAEAVA